MVLRCFLILLLLYYYFKWLQGLDLHQRFLRYERSELAATPPCDQNNNMSAEFCQGLSFRIMNKFFVVVRSVRNLTVRANIHIADDANFH